MFGLRSRVTLSPGAALTFSGARLDLGGLGDGEDVTVQLTIMPSGAILLPDSQATVASIDTAGCESLPPTFNAAGVTNAASFESGITPGSIATLFGANLSTGLAGILQATTLPLPLTLGGTSLTINSIPAPLFAVANIDGQQQINFQVPWELAQLALPSQVDLIVTRNGVSSAPVMVELVEALPGIFTSDGTRAVMLHGSGPDRNMPVTDSNPARPLEIVTLFATGLGPVTNSPTTGQAAAAEPLSHTILTPEVFIGGSRAEIESAAWFSGLVPGFAGLYQVNFFIPFDVLPGPRGLVIHVGDRTSRVATVPVE
jgi:uncharacterized protein (TIGR03437 family)